MVFQVPESRASIKQNVFEFKVPGSKKTWVLPKLQYLNADQSERLTATSARMKATRDEGGKIDPTLAAEISHLQREIIEEHCPGLYALIDGEQMSALIEAWQEASTVSLGESSASPAN